MSEDNNRIARVEIENTGVVRFRADVEREVQVAIFDLVQGNRFRPEAAHFGETPDGPYSLTLAISENRLNFNVATEDGAAVGTVMIPLGSFRKIIKDYFTVCASYYEAIRSASPSQIEAIDMGRRGLHNEGSERLRSLLSSCIEVDHDTSRRLFTLLCALHFRA